MSLSSEYASRDEFRILVIALSVVLMILIGPRSSVYFIQDEKVVKISKQYFVFKKSYEYELINTDICTKNKKMYLILNDKKIVIAYSGSKIDFDYIATRIKKITEEH